MKNHYKVIIIIIVFCLLFAYGVYRAFFNIQQIKGHEIFKEVPFPSDKNIIKINYEASFFHEFYVQDNTVKIRCELSIYNSSEKDIKFYIKAKFLEDVNKLLSQENLIIKDENEKEKIFELKANQTKKFEVLFCGEYGGTYQKNDRNLPDVITFEIIREE